MDKRTLGRNTNVINQILASTSSKQNFHRFNDYLDGKDVSLINDLCNGREILPYPEFFDELLKNKNDNKLLNFIILAKEESKKFYINAFNIGLNSTDDSAAFFNKFLLNAQPHGQKLINFLIMIRLYYIDNELKNSKNSFMNFFTKIIIIIRQKTFTSENFEHNNYSFFFHFIIILFSILTFYIAGGHYKIIPSTIASISIGLTGFILYAICYSKNEFEATDISGKNLIAAKYRLLFNAEYSLFIKKVNSKPKTHIRMPVIIEPIKFIQEKYIEVS